MGDSLSVEVTQTSEELLEAALYLGSVHTTFANGSVQISTCTKLHDFAPGMIFVLHKVDRLHNIGVMKGRRDAKLRCKLLDVLLFTLILSTLPKLLEDKGGQRDQRGQVDRGAGWVTVP